MICALCDKEVKPTESIGVFLYYFDSDKYPNRTQIYDVHEGCLDERLRRRVRFLWEVEKEKRTLKLIGKEV